MKRVRPCRCINLSMVVPAAGAEPLSFTRVSAYGFRSTCDAYVLSRCRPQPGGPSKAWEWAVRRSADANTILAQGVAGECPRSRQCGQGPLSPWKMAPAPAAKGVVPAVFMLRVTTPGLEAAGGVYGALEGCRLRFGKVGSSEVGAVLRGDTRADQPFAKLDYVVSYLPETNQFELCARRAGGGIVAVYGLAVPEMQPGGPGGPGTCVVWGRDPHPSAPQHAGEITMEEIVGVVAAGAAGQVSVPLRWGQEHRRVCCLTAPIYRMLWAVYVIQLRLERAAGVPLPFLPLELWEMVLSSSGLMINDSE